MILNSGVWEGWEVWGVWEDLVMALRWNIFLYRIKRI